MNKISFDVNNQGTLAFIQDEHDGWVKVHRYDADGRKTYGTTIPSSDFVMLWNLYNYIKENDIQNDFINPYGLQKEE